MKAVFCLLTLLTVLGAYGFEEQAKETIRQTFPAAKRLEVDNVYGSIHVTGYSGTEIQMIAEKTIRADSPARLAEAQREVRLDTTQTADRVSLYVNGPFRCNCGDGRHGVSDNGQRGYRVTYDFDLKVPAGTSVELATVNHGGIEVKNITGDFDVRNVNGAIELNEVAGSGRAHTVNGGVKVLFAKNPEKDCSFKTVNGSVDVSFRPNLSANVRLKTFNGEAYTDFEATAVPVSPISERRNGKFVYHSNRASAFRIGAGGPEISIDTLNGNIRMINRGQQ